MKIRVLACLCVTWFLLVAGGEKPKAFLHCYVQLFPHTGMKETEVIPVQLSNPRSMIFVSSTPDLSETDMEYVEILPEGNTLIVFNKEGKRKLAAITQATTDSILVVVCSGRVVYAPLIDTVITTGRLLIPDGLTQEEADELGLVMKIKHSGTETLSSSLPPAPRTDEKVHSQFTQTPE